MKAISLLALVWFIVVFIISGLVINFGQVLIRPLLWFKPDFYRRLNAKLLYLLFHQLTVLGEWWGSINITIYGSQEELNMIGTESCILLANHYSDIDFLVGWIITERYDCLGGIKSFAKDSSKYIPIFGWSWYFSDFGFLKRNWEEDKSGFFSTLEVLKRYPVVFWISIMPEGTRRTPEKLQASQEFAKASGIEPLKYHLLPRPKGLAVAVRELGASLPAVYEMELGLDNPDSATFATLIYRGTINAHVKFKRIPMKSIPKDTLEDTCQWCKQVFRQKDAEHEYFAQHGKFQEPVIQLKPRKLKNLLTFGTLNVLVGVFVSKLLCCGAANFGVWPVVAFALLVMLSGLLLVQRLLRETESKRGSTYGLQAKPAAKDAKSACAPAHGKQD